GVLILFRCEVSFGSLLIFSVFHQMSADIIRVSIENMIP
ncbi:hypothetical protein X975_26505, partial [Stegodyphus mimosarum]